MLVIREQQMRVLGAEMRRRFIEKMARHLRSITPQTTISDADLITLIERGIQQAATFGLTAESHVARFLEYVMAYGPEFGTDAKTAWAGAILRTPGVSHSWKLNRIDECDLFVQTDDHAPSEHGERRAGETDHREG